MSATLVPLELVTGPEPEPEVGPDLGELLWPKGGAGQESLEGLEVGVVRCPCCRWPLRLEQTRRGPEFLCECPGHQGRDGGKQRAKSVPAVCAGGPGARPGPARVSRRTA